MLTAPIRRIVGSRINWLAERLSGTGLPWSFQGLGPMQSRVSISPRPSMKEVGIQASCTLHVCTSCRSPESSGDPKEIRPGFVLYRQLREVLGSGPLRDRVNVEPAECLSICPRPCGIALSSHGAWTYLFGDQQPSDTAADLVECIAFYLESKDGFMTRKQRPETLRKSILGRVPPLAGGQKCT